MADIPKTLEKIVDFLRDESFQLSEDLRLDDRGNSAINKYTIFELLQKISIPHNPNYKKDWYDFNFSDEKSNIFCPVKIKISTTKTADNLNCKLGIYYALTGQLPPFNNNNVEWENYFRSLKQGIKENDRDYYFLIINKDDLQDIFATSLKQLRSIVPNGDNLPFQAKWDDNRPHLSPPKDFNYVKNLILSAFEESLRLRAETYSYFKQNF